MKFPPEAYVWLTSNANARQASAGKATAVSLLSPKSRRYAPPLHEADPLIVPVNFTARGEEPDVGLAETESGDEGGGGGGGGGSGGGPAPYTCTVAEVRCAPAESVTRYVPPYRY